jgi:hypothetical protein
VIFAGNILDLCYTLVVNSTLFETIAGINYKWMAEQFEWNNFDLSSDVIKKSCNILFGKDKKYHQMLRQHITCNFYSVRTNAKLFWSTNFFPIIIS